jgi:hypothetical protein
MLMGHGLTGQHTLTHDPSAFGDPFDPLIHHLLCTFLTKLHGKVTKIEQGYEKAETVNKTFIPEQLALLIQLSVKLSPKSLCYSWLYH